MPCGALSGKLKQSADRAMFESWRERIVKGLLLTSVGLPSLTLADRVECQNDESVLDKVYVELLVIRRHSLRVEVSTLDRHCRKRSGKISRHVNICRNPKVWPALK